jgi:hypothetical protein
MNDRNCCAIRATSCSTKSASKARKAAGAHALVIGAGGLGSPAACTWPSAGVGRITLVDDDEVDLTNLQRQVMHTTSASASPRSNPAARRCADQSRDRGRRRCANAWTARAWPNWWPMPTWYSTAATTSPPATPSTAPAWRPACRWCRAP